MRRQKKIRNIKYKDIYNLDSTIAKFILPRLKIFRKKTCSYPDGFTFEDWKATLDKMILAFELILDDNEPDFVENKCHIEKVNDKFSKLVEDFVSTFDFDAYRKWHKDKQKTIKEGLKLFAEYFQNLWF